MKIVKNKNKVSGIAEEKVISDTKESANRVVDPKRIPETENDISNLLESMVSEHDKEIADIINDSENTVNKSAKS